MYKNPIHLLRIKRRPGTEVPGRLGHFISTCRPREIRACIGEKVEKHRDIKSGSKLFYRLLYHPLRILTAKNGKFYRKLHMVLENNHRYRLLECMNISETKRLPDTPILLLSNSTCLSLIKILNVLDITKGGGNGLCHRL